MSKTPRQVFLEECKAEFHQHLQSKGIVGYIRHYWTNAPEGILIAKENKEDGYIYLGWSKLNTKSSDRWNKYEGFHHALPRLTRFVPIGILMTPQTLVHDVDRLIAMNDWRPDIYDSLYYMAARALAYYKGEPTQCSQ